MPVIVLLFIIIFIGVVYLLWCAHKKNVRKRLFVEPLPQSFIDIIEKNVGLYHFLTDDLKKELHGHVQVFLNEKSFEGCAGLEITDVIRVTIAAQACMLLLHHQHNAYFPKCDSILVYPHTYVARRLESLGGMGYVEKQTALLGESSSQGTVVLAWDNVQQSVRNIHDGQNVVLHEFAHQLDQEDGVADGIPILEAGTSYKTWAHILTDEYDHLKDKLRHHKVDVMNAYGATNPAEFFAVATETFFEKGAQMKNAHPELYVELKDYYHMDPATWRD